MTALDVAGNISIHAPLAGCDETYKIAQMGDAVFQSTHPLRGATCLAKLKDKTDEISIHAPLAGCDLIARPAHHVRLISIHAPLAGRDPVELIAGLHDGNFNPRAPCGARPCRRHAQVGAKIFQSTRPLRGATLNSRRKEKAMKFQSTRPLRGATVYTLEKADIDHISIHAPLAGRDWPRRARKKRRRHFNPRAPCGARPASRSAAACARYFNPRAPCGARRQGARRGRVCHNFNPRAPCGARLLQHRCLRLSGAISIHAPLAGRDPKQRAFADFYIISIHAPLAGRDDGAVSVLHDALSISIHAPLAGRDPEPPSPPLSKSYFNPRAPCGARQQT